METDVLIIGGGLSGLYLADQLNRAGVDFQLLEARDRFGGRISTFSHMKQEFDLGPAWFWPGQPRISSLVDRFSLRKFDQYSIGILSYEDERGHVQRGEGFASMQGSWRLEGGFQALIHALRASFPEDRLHLSMALKSLSQEEDGVIGVTVNGLRVRATRAVLCLPPRVAAEKIVFNPPLTQPAQKAMEDVPTWMAGQAKALAVFDRPFWREAGLSGDAMSRMGPMVEIHDASPVENGPYALFGFIGVPPQHRRDQDRLKEQILAQLVRLFGDDAGAPIALTLKDWASDPWTSTPLDQAPLYAHPHYGLPPVLRDLWDGSLVMSGTEVGSQFGGFLEGALEAAEDSFSALMKDQQSGS